MPSSMAGFEVSKRGRDQRRAEPAIRRVDAVLGDDDRHAAHRMSIADSVRERRRVDLLAGIVDWGTARYRQPPFVVPDAACVVLHADEKWGGSGRNPFNGMLLIGN